MQNIHLELTVVEVNQLLAGLGTHMTSYQELANKIKLQGDTQVAAAATATDAVATETPDVTDVIATETPTA